MFASLLIFNQRLLRLALQVISIMQMLLAVTVIAASVSIHLLQVKIANPFIPTVQLTYPLNSTLREIGFWFILSINILLIQLLKLTLQRLDTIAPDGDQLEQLREQELRWRLAIEGNNDTIWDWDILNNQTYRTPDWCDFVGCSKQELNSSNDDWSVRIHPDDFERVMSANQDYLTGKTNYYRIEYRLRCEGGTYKWVLSQGKKLLNQHGHPIRMIGTMRDITSRKVAQQELQRSEERFRRAFDDAAIGMALVATDGQFLQVNRSLCEIVGYAEAELLSLTFQQITHPDDLPGNLTYFLQVIAGETRTYQMEKRYIHKQRKVVWILINASLIRDNQAKPLYLVTQIQDISDRKQIELELQRAKEYAEAANLAKSAFLANMSHELRTPLNAILGFAQLISRDPDTTAEQQEHLSIITRSGNHLLSLINDVLDLSKIEAGKISLQESNFDLFDLLISIEQMLRLRAESKGLKLRMDLAAELPRYIIGDPNKLRQVLINLLSNAIKFTPSGQITLKVSCLTNPPPLVGHPLRLHFVVSDTGVGIAATDLERIFDAFTQAQSGSAQPEGTGLGLTISRKFVQLMGGQLGVSSTLGQGSAFWFDIPVHLSPDHALPLVELKRQVIGLSPGQPTYRILVVDDQPENRQLLMKLLDLPGLSLAEAGDAETAIALWQHHRPHLILLDLRLPVIDGLAVARRIRATSEYAVVIIALTAQVLEQDRDRALTAGCNDFISKPFQEQELFSKIEQHLGLGFVYKEPPGSASLPLPDQVAVSSTELTIMSPEWISELDYAASCCNSQQVGQLINQIPSTHQSLSERLGQLAHHFQFDRILEATRTLEKNITI